MKKSLVFIIAGILVSLNIYGGTRYVSNRYKSINSQKKTELHQNLEITFGYVPKNTTNALKGSVSVNNFVFKRVGLYSSIEKGLSSDYFANTFGITASANKYIYLWGGLDIATMFSLISNQDVSISRKEIGIGINPFKMTVIRVGWSRGVGPTLSAGIQIPL
jgi:hypothetical protein